MIILPEDLKELVNLRVSMEEWFLGHHLCKNAGHTPHVDWAGIPMRAQQDLWGSIPQSHHLRVTNDYANLVR